MTNKRIDKWKEPRKITTLITGGDNDEIQRIIAIQKEYRNGNSSAAPELRSHFIIAACKELVYDRRDGSPMFHAIMYSLNSASVEIEISNILEIHFKSSAQECIDDEVREMLALATIEEVPVYPNTPDLAQELLIQHRKMLTDGFTAPDGKGGRVQLKLARKTEAEFIDIEAILKINMLNTYLPAEIAMILQTVRYEIQRRDSAGRILGALSLAISELESLLDSGNRNENALQRCLTNNPILFGTDYVRIVPKHRLGSEYEMDYALERTTAQFDLVEIEASNLKLFNKSGKPTANLVHAEQQVLDWLNWIGRHGLYARENLPDLVSPVGFVVMGRRQDLDETTISKLKQRNAIFRGKLYVLTYDDLLDKARNTSRILNGLANSSEKSHLA